MVVLSGLPAIYPHELHAQAIAITQKIRDALQSIGLNPLRLLIPQFLNKFCRRLILQLLKGVIVYVNPVSTINDSH